MYRYLTITAVFLCFCMAGFAQSQHGSLVTRYTTETGLPSNGLKGLEFDSQTGFLWVVSEAGIVRFNGADFKLFNKENLPQLSSERMEFILRSDDDKIFAEDENEKVFRVLANKPEYCEYPAFGKSFRLKHRLVLLLSDTFLVQKIFQDVFTNRQTNYLKAIPMGNKTACFILDMKGRLSYYSTERSEVINISMASSGVKELFKIGEQCFYESRDGHFYIVDPYTGTCSPVDIMDDEGRKFKEDLHKSLLCWENGMKAPLLFNDNNVWQFSYKDHQIKATLICESIPLNCQIRTSRYDEKNRLLFIATESQGLIIVKPAYLQQIKRPKSEVNETNAYYAQVDLGGHSILSNSAQLLGEPADSRRPLPIQGKFNTTVFNFRDSILFFSQSMKDMKDNCLHSYDYSTGKTIVYPKIKVTESFAACYSGGKIIIASHEGLGLLAQDSLSFYFRIRSDNQNANSPYAMEEISPDVFLVASCSGLIEYNIRTGQSDTILTCPGYCIRNLTNIKGYIFIGTYGKGFYIFKDGRLRHMPMDKGNYLLYTHCFVADQFGFVWISTNHGLFKAQYRDLENAFEREESTVFYYYFGKKDGMEMTEMNGGCAPCALIMKDSLFSFPTMDGLLWVDPGKVKLMMPAGQLYIDEFIVDAKSVSTDSLTTKGLPSGTKSILVQLGFSAWCNNENIYLDYRLANDEKWRPLRNASEGLIRFDNLTCGSYVLQIRKRDGFGAENYTYKELAFVIETPWYKQWGFYFILAIAILAGGRFYIYLRTKQLMMNQGRLEKLVDEKTKALLQKNDVLEKINRINSRLISIISHDIITPLKFVTVGGKELIAKRDRMSEELQMETIMEITNTAQEIQLLSTNVMNWIKFQNENRRQNKEIFSVFDLVNQDIGVLHSIARQKNITIQNRVEKDFQLCQYLEPLKILIYNLLSNAINFSENADIAISSESNVKGIALHVKDEGVGMTPEQIQNIMSDQFIISSVNIDKRKGNGLGYLIIKDLLKMVEGSISIRSTKWKGTVVSVFIPSLDQ